MDRALVPLRDDDHFYTWISRLYDSCCGRKCELRIKRKARLMRRSPGWSSISKVLPEDLEAIRHHLATERAVLCKTDLSGVENKL
jgi:hypothetical protein